MGGSESKPTVTVPQAALQAEAARLAAEHRRHLPIAIQVQPARLNAARHSRLEKTRLHRLALVDGVAWQA